MSAILSMNSSSTSANMLSAAVRKHTVRQCRDTHATLCRIVILAHVVQHVPMVFARAHVYPSLCRDIKYAVCRIGWRDLGATNSLTADINNQRRNRGEETCSSPRFLRRWCVDAIPRGWGRAGRGPWRRDRDGVCTGSCRLAAMGGHIVLAEGTTSREVKRSLRARGRVGCTTSGERGVRRRNLVRWRRA